MSETAGAAPHSCDGPRIDTERVYDLRLDADPPAGRAFLVERLWPRGFRKEALVRVTWLKDVAPSHELRRWFGHRPERWEEFQRRYREELEAQREGGSASLTRLLTAARQGPVTLLYSARDRTRNSAVVLRAWLLERL